MHKDILVPPDIGPRWIEIDLDAITHNVLTIKSLLQPGTRLMAVVKADAYGCGAVEVSRAVLEAGADMLGVTTVDEGMELREQGIEAPILVFAPLSPREVEEVLSNKLIATVDNPKVIDAFSILSAPARIHLKINTGMNRFGMEPAQARECILRAEEVPGLVVEGIYTHLATTPVTGKAFVEKQFHIFRDMISSLEEQGLTVPPIKHICNSGAVLNMPHMHLDMVRVGNLLYGQYPFGYQRDQLMLKDPWQARARLVHIRQVNSGDTVGYGGDFRAKKVTRVGIVPVGFADGLDVVPQFKPKSFSDLVRMVMKTILSFFGRRIGTPLARLDGKPLNIVGRIGMQVAAVDLSKSPQAQPGDAIEVFLRRTTAGSRLPRVYFSQGRLTAVRTISGSRSYREGYASVGAFTSPE